tara:strand:+ start:194 stop:304 length:111 start_codon:yes stop_codon:yes gene_type:complete
LRNPFKIKQGQADEQQYEADAAGQNDRVTKAVLSLW